METNPLHLLIFALLYFNASSADRLVIEKIRCVRVATGIDNWSRGGISALGGLIAGGATALAGGAVVVGTGGAAIGTVPVTVGAVAAAGASGASGALKALEFMDAQVGSGTDHLIVNVNGEKVFPSGNYYSIEAGQTIKPNVHYDFNRGCRIQLIEYDWGSDNDDLGHIDVSSDAWDKVAPGKDYKVKEAIVLSLTEGNLYYVDYRVERNSGSVGPKWVFCGTATCKACPKAWCKGTSNSGLDRDKDKSDLKKCPYPMITRDYKKYPQSWPFADVYLRICSSPGAK